MRARKKRKRAFLDRGGNQGVYYILCEEILQNQRTGGWREYEGENDFPLYAGAAGANLREHVGEDCGLAGGADDPLYPPAHDRRGGSPGGGRPGGAVGSADGGCRPGGAPGERVRQPHGGGRGPGLRRAHPSGSVCPDHPALRGADRPLRPTLPHLPDDLRFLQCSDLHPRHADPGGPGPHPAGGGHRRDADHGRGPGLHPVRHGPGADLRGDLRLLAGHPPLRPGPAPTGHRGPGHAGEHLRHPGGQSPVQGGL